MEANCACGAVPVWEAQGHHGGFKMHLTRLCSHCMAHIWKTYRPLSDREMRHWHQSRLNIPHH